MSFSFGGPRHYSRISIALHWLTLLLIAGAYATMEFRSAFPRGSAERALMATWHYGLGLTIFVLVWLRLLARLAGPHPSIEPPPPHWQELLAASVRLALYAFLIGLPVVGWFAVSAKGAPVSIAGWPLPMLIGKDTARGKQLEEVHEVIANFGYFLISVHAAAALFHHYVRRDNTLRLMLPRAS